MSSESSVKPKKFVTVLRAYSAVKMPKGEALRIAFRDSFEPPDAMVTISTVHAEVPDVGWIPAFLTVEVVNYAADMESAVQDAHARAAGLTSFLSVTSNAAIGDLSLDICFDATEGSLDHDVVQYF